MYCNVCKVVITWRVCSVRMNVCMNVCMCVRSLKYLYITVLIMSAYLYMYVFMYVFMNHCRLQYLQHMYDVCMHMIRCIHRYICISIWSNTTASVYDVYTYICSFTLCIHVWYMWW